MTFVINVPGLLLDFYSQKFRKKYEELEEYILSEKVEDKKINEFLNDLDSTKLKILEDAYSIEELSYRSRIFVFSYLNKYYIQRALIQFNLDPFITDVISLNALIPCSKKDLVNKIISILHGKNWIFLTHSKIQANIFKGNGIKTVLISEEDGNNFKNLIQFIDFTSSHKIDNTLYVSKGCK